MNKFSVSCSLERGGGGRGGEEEEEGRRRGGGGEEEGRRRGGGGVGNYKHLTANSFGQSYKRMKKR